MSKRQVGNGGRPKGSRLYQINKGLDTRHLIESSMLNNPFQIQTDLRRRLNISSGVCSKHYRSLRDYYWQFWKEVVPISKPLKYADRHKMVEELYLQNPFFTQSRLAYVLGVKNQTISDHFTKLRKKYEERKMREDTNWKR